MENELIENHQKYMTFLQRLHSEETPVLVFDGATGTSIQQFDLTSDDFGGLSLEGCNENLVRTRPDVVEAVHRKFLEAGSDVIETNSFGASSVVLAEYGLEQIAFEINKLATQIAKKVANEYSTKDKPRFVAGSIGPTTKLPTLGHISFDKLRDSYQEQAEGLIAGGVDLFIIETCQDVLQIKAALQGVELANKNYSKDIPIMVSVTMETTGTMLVGTEIQAALTILEPYNIQILGLNCATGPEQMKDHITYLSKHSRFSVSCIPNAGLPENIGGVAHYRLTPIELKMQLMHFIKDLGVRVIGGCCGTTPEHIKELSELSKEISISYVDSNNLPKPNKRRYTFEPSSASIYSSTPYSQDNSFLIVGERLNASGSKKVRDLLNNNDWDGLVSIGRGQLKENAHILDVNVDYVGRDGVSDMKELVSRLVTNVNLPLMLDSTEWEKMESGLKVAGGKCILNSTNYEDGKDRFFKVLSLAKSYGAAVVIGTIDEEGMARTAVRKFQIAERAYKDAINFGIPPSEIFYDPLALPISTGVDEDRHNGLETIRAIKKIRSELDGVHVLLGLSNISFGLSQAARITLNSVFLHQCCEAGLDTAIISPAKILPLSKIDVNHKEICLDLINDKRRFKNGICEYDPLTELTTQFEGVSAKQARESGPSIQELPIEERLQRHIIDGEKIGLTESLDIALESYKPLLIINTFLLSGMKTVGELFGSGQMQLPFVLQSAETMKTAVSYLEPFMDKSSEEDNQKARFLIATVKGDVHDIGKNLVDIILTNNGYEVINLGIKQDVSAIINAQLKYKTDCIAMSGLLVKSTAFMKDNLEAFNKANISVPVILGGAALTPKFVNQDCSSVYKGKVIYGKDAFTDLRFMDAYISSKKEGNWDDLEGFLNGIPEGITIGESNSHKNIPETDPIKATNLASEGHKLESNDDIKRSTVVCQEKPISPPFIGYKLLTDNSISIDKIIDFLDINALFSSQWQMKKIKSQSREEYEHYLKQEAQPILKKWINRIKEEKLLTPSATYGYFPCARIGNQLIIFSEDSSVSYKINLPRQKGGNRYCISDFYCELVNNEPIDFLPMQAVTMGIKATEFAQSLYEKNLYSDYLFFHGLAVQLAEAFAEYVHSIIRKECGFSYQEPDNLRDILAQRYRGCRYSFGYPACPNVSDSRIQLELLKAHKIDLTIDDSDQLHPEQSTTALIALHSKAKYFSA